MQGVFLPDWFSPAFWIGLAVLFAMFWRHLRHLGVAALVVAGPLLGYALAGMACRIFHTGFSSPSFALLPAVAVSGFLASGIEAKIADGLWVREAVRATLRAERWKLGWSLLLAALLADIGFGTGPSIAALEPGFVVVSAGVAGLLVVALGIPLFSFGEDFIALINRITERRERRLDALTFVVQLRWGWSVSGIVLVFAALGFFGGQNAAVAWPFGLQAVRQLPLAAAVLLAVCYAATRDIRRTAAFGLSALLVMLLTYWIFAKLAAMGVHRAPVSVWMAFATGIVPMLIAAAESAGFARAGDNFAVSTLRMFENAATTTVFVTAGAALSAAVQNGFGEGLLILGCGAAVLIAMPALTTAIYGLFPPRVSLDAYRLR